MYTVLLSLLEQQKIEYKKDYLLANISSFKTGGNADLFVSPKTEEEVKTVVNTCQKENIPYFVIGNASNLLISDDGFRGVIVRIGPSFSKIEYLGDGKIQADAGVSLASLCSFALKHNLSGLEFAYGIPGTAGGAVYMNAGAYGGEMKDVLLSASHIAPDGTCSSFEGTALKLSYRSSAYSNSSYVITSLLLQLKAGNHDEIKCRMDELLKKRKDKQPLEFPSAGSTFKRPEGYFAGALIEECGLKGYSVGGAQVSEKHAGFVINKGNATTKDICMLIQNVQTIVKDKTGVELETEVRYLG